MTANPRKIRENQKRKQENETIGRGEEDSDN